jgi:hypothetical protein
LKIRGALRAKQGKEARQSTVGGREPSIDNGQSRIGNLRSNRQSTIENRQSPVEPSIDNGQSRIGNLQPPVK